MTTGAVYAETMPGNSWSPYVLKTPGQEVTVSALAEASKDSDGSVLLTFVEMTAGTLNVDQSIYVMVQAVSNESGEIAVRLINLSGDDTELSGMIEGTTLNATGGTISAILHGDTELKVTGKVEINGDNGQTGDITIDGPEARLTAGTNTALGAASVKLYNGATLDLNHQVVNNAIEGAGLHDCQC